MWDNKNKNNGCQMVSLENFIFEWTKKQKALELSIMKNAKLSFNLTANVVV